MREKIHKVQRELPTFEIRSLSTQNEAIEVEAGKHKYGAEGTNQPETATVSQVHAVEDSGLNGNTKSRELELRE